MDKRTTFLGRTEQGIFAQGLFTSLEKTAAAPSSHWDTAEAIRSYIKTITPADKKKYCYVLVNALGAGEFFGSNINADYFPWEALAHEGDDFGYKTFLKAHAYTHHANKDPEKAIGIPVVSVLNPRMKRVELIIRLDREKAKLEGADGIITRIDNGEFPDVSMGCKVPFDICSICAHQSKTRDDYCEHMRPSETQRLVYGPNKILPDGRKIYVINTVPRFFDISFVFIGADKTAKVMAKLASKGNQTCLGNVCALHTPGMEDDVLYTPHGDRLDAGRLRKVAAAASCDVEGRRGPCGRLCAECSDRASCETNKLASAFHVKESAHRKMSEIIKNIPTGTFASKRLPSMESGEKDIPRAVLDRMSECPLADALGAPTSLGMVLKPHEFQRIVLIRIGEDGLADELDHEHRVFQPSNRFSDIAPPAIPALPQLLRLLLPLMAERSSFGPSLKIRVVRANLGDAKKALPTRDPIEHPLLDKISAAYNGYRRNVMLKLSQVRDAVSSDPKLRQMILGDALVNTFSKTASQNEIVTQDSVAYMMGAHLSDRSLLSTTRDAITIAVANPWLREEHSA